LLGHPLIRDLGERRINQIRIGRIDGLQTH
jgi:hypothetical protein